MVVPLGYSGLWELRKNPSKPLRKNLSIHINIYMEKSLKQREQLEGYLRDQLQKEKVEEDE